MRSPSCVAFTVLVGLVVTGCATAPPATTSAVAPTAGTSCREIIKPGEKEGQVYCGTAEQWAELDRRMALINAGVTCRTEQPMIAEMCLTPAQWKAYRQQARDYRERITMGASTQQQPVLDNASYGLTTAMPTGVFDAPPPPPPGAP